MKIKAVAILMSVLIIFTGCGKKNELTNVDKGMDYFEKQQYEEAVKEFEVAVDAKKDLQLAYRGMGMAYLELKSYEKALEYFQLALDQSKGKVGDLEVDISYYKAASEIGLGKQEDAIKTYSALLEYDEENVEGYFLRGSVYLSLGKEDKAKKDFEQAVAIESNQYDLYLNIYQDLKGAGFEEEGNKYLTKALKIEGKESEHMFGKGRVYFEQGAYDKAKTELESAIGEGNEEALFYLARVHEALGDLEAAKSTYQEYITKNKKNGSAYNALGLIQMKQGNYQEALATFQNGIENGTKNAQQELKFNEIVAYEFVTDFATAKAKMEAYLQEYPEDQEATRENQFLQTR